jgi:hypothetical protein
LKWNLKGDLWERIGNKKAEPDTGRQQQKGRIGKKLRGKVKQIVTFFIYTYTVK